VALASRLSRIQESATLEVSRRAAALRARGVAVVDLGVGEPDFDSPPSVVAAAQRALDAGFTRYTAAAGIPELRRGIAQRYQKRHSAPWGADQVAVTVGAKAALFELALALFEPGDEVVLPTPAWVSFPAQVEITGATVVAVPMRAEDGFAVRAEPLIAAFSPRTRAVIVNSPCNPTGGVMSAVDLERLVEAAAERGVLVISDETYDQFVYDGARQASAASLAARFPDTVVLVGSFSKTWAMTGWRLGWAIGPPEVVDGVLRVQGHATSNPTSFAMMGALAALEEPQSEMARRLAEYQVRRDLVLGKLAAIPGVTCPPPAGAFYVFPDFAAHYDDELSGSLAMARYLLDEAHVAVVPGEAFGAGGERHLRISFAASREELGEGLDRIARALEKLESRRSEKRAAATC
jgi:aspartate aminotransferase